MSEAMDGDAPLLCHCCHFRILRQPLRLLSLMLSRPDWIFSTLDIQFELVTQI